MESVLAIVLLSFVGLSQGRWSDETACVGDQSVKFNIGSPDDPLTISFDCYGKEGKETITKCFFHGVDTKVDEGTHKSITLPSGNTYKLHCNRVVAPTIFWVLAAGFCKSDSPKATIGVQDSTEKMDVSFKCNLLKSKISKCIIPVGESKKSFSASDKTEGRFGGRSGRKYVITCKELYVPTITEDYSAERCYEKTKFVDSIAVTGKGKESGEKMEVEFTCVRGMIDGCRPPGGNVISANSNVQASFTKGNAEFKLSCFSTSPPIITP